MGVGELGRGKGKKEGREAKEEGLIKQVLK